MRLVIRRYQNNPGDINDVAVSVDVGLVALVAVVSAIFFKSGTEQRKSIAEKGEIPEIKCIFASVCVYKKKVRIDFDKGFYFSGATVTEPPSLRAPRNVPKLDS